MAITSTALHLTVVFSFLTLAGRITGYIAIPPWIDSFHDSSSPFLNISNITDYNDTDVIDILPGDPPERQISFIFLIFGQYLTSAVIFGLILLLILIFRPHQIKDAHKNFSHRNILISGFSQAISSILMNFAMSGTRTPPYLQALLGNFTIPIQFVVRFLVLRKRSTKLRLVCAGVVVVAEFICLIPSIFPGLETDSQRKEDGGASGAGRILWPLSMIMSTVPYALANALMEGSVQGSKSGNDDNTETKTRSARYDTDVNHTTDTDNDQLIPESTDPPSQESSKPQINIFYYGFFWCMSGSVTICAFFWTDLIPHFGTAANIHLFGEILAYNAGCLFGLNGCGSEVCLTGWIAFVSCFVATLGFAGLMRYSEGANFVVILLSMRTPIVFLFWTLFDEHPLQWHPHVSLATWLSIPSIFMMLPAIIIYQMGMPKCNWLRFRRNNSGILVINEDQEYQSLNQDGQHQHIESRDAV